MPWPGLAQRFAPVLILRFHFEHFWSQRSDEVLARIPVFRNKMHDKQGATVIVAAPVRPSQNQRGCRVGASRKGDREARGRLQGGNKRRRQTCLLGIGSGGNREKLWRNWELESVYRDECSLFHRPASCTPPWDNAPAATWGLAATPCFVPVLSFCMTERSAKTASRWIGRVRPREWKSSACQWRKTPFGP